MCEHIFDKYVRERGFFGFLLTLFFPIVVLLISAAYALLRPFTRGKTKADLWFANVFAWLFDINCATRGDNAEEREHK